MEGCAQYVSNALSFCAEVPWPAALAEAAATVIGYALVRALIRLLRG